MKKHQQLLMDEKCVTFIQEHHLCRRQNKTTYRKIYGAGARVTRNARTEAPYRLQVIEKLTICANCLKSPRSDFGLKSDSYFENSNSVTSETETKSAFLFTHFDKMWSHARDHGRVPLHHRREAHLQLGLGVARSFHDVLGLLTPGHKVLVLIHFGDYIIHFLH